MGRWIAIMAPAIAACALAVALLMMSADRTLFG
jgi:hypothetical protein